MDVFPARLKSVARLFWITAVAGSWGGGVNSIARAELKLDTVVTTDGRTLTGAVTLAGGQVRIKSAEGKITPFKMDDVNEINFSPREPVADPHAKSGAVVRHGLKAEYYSDPYFKQLRAVRLEPDLDFQVKADTPSHAIDNDFSARWTGQIVVESTGTYTFAAVGDGVRSIEMKIQDATVNGGAQRKKILDATSGPVELTAGKPVSLTVEAAGITAYASIHLRWGRGTNAVQLVPTDLLLPPAAFTDAVLRDWIATDAGAGMVAQYFKGDEFDGPAVTILEPSPIGGDRGPFRGTKEPFCTRWTGQLESPADGELELLVSREIRQPVRVWLDGKPILDTYADGNARKPSAKFPAKAGQRFDLRVESGRTKGMPGDERSLVFWSGPKWKSEPLPRDRLFPPADAPRPMLLSASQAFPPGASDDLELETVFSGPAPISPVTVELTDDRGRLIASDGIAPYRFDLGKIFTPVDKDAGASSPEAKVNKPHKNRDAQKPDDPAIDWSDVRRVLARATDARGHVGVSMPFNLPPRAPDDSTLGDGWKNIAVGTSQRKLAVSPNASPARLELAGAGGSVLQDRDQFHFLFQRLADDGQVEARLSITGQSTDVQPDRSPVSGGLMIRDGLDPRARYLAVFTTGSQLTVVRRDGFGALPSFAQLPNITLPCFVRLRHDDSKISAFISPDGKTWTELPVDPLPLAGECFAGVCNLGGQRDVVTFESLTVESGGTDSAAYPPGVQLVDGTVLGGRIRALTDQTVTLSRTGEDDQQILRTVVAKILFQAVSPATLAGAGTRRGVLLPQGDVFESDTTVVTPESVSVESVIFGPRTFRPSEVAAVLLADVSAPSAPASFEVRLVDGSNILADEIKVEQTDIVVCESKLRPIKLAAADVRSIHRPAMKAR